MIYFVIGVTLLGLIVLLGQAYVNADPRALTRALRYGVATLLLAVGAVLLLAERWGLALPLLAAGISALTVGRIGPVDLRGSRRAAGSSSTVRSAFLDMRLDHDSGDMSGRVVAGTHAGRGLDELGEAELIDLHGEVARDSESLALLEAYLDRRIPGWREHVEGDEAAGAGGTTDTGAMTDEEAYEVLGLAPGAGNAEIRAAHRRLMMRVHPDQGGSTFLAAKINEAKDRLLGKHR